MLGPNAGRELSSLTPDKGSSTLRRPSGISRGSAMLILCSNIPGSRHFRFPASS
jgi:hypothetical protein